MLLAVDIGNTNIVIGINNGNKWIAKWRIMTDPLKMPDEYCIIIRDLLRNSSIDRKSLKRAVISSVVPQLSSKWITTIKSVADLNPLFLGPGVKTGIRIKTENPVEVGADMIANAVAALNICNNDCIIVDYGTALTFSAVRANGDFLGAAIAPGINSAAEVLSSHTAQLPHVRLDPPNSAIGKNSVTSIQSGVIFGYIGMTEYLVNKMKNELNPKATVFACGGQAERFAALTNCFDYSKSYLILEGLRIISEKNENWDYHS